MTFIRFFKKNLSIILTLSLGLLLVSCNAANIKSTLKDNANPVADVKKHGTVGLRKQTIRSRKAKIVPGKGQIVIYNAPKIRNRITHPTHNVLVNKKPTETAVPYSAFVVNTKAGNYKVQIDPKRNAVSVKGSTYSKKVQTVTVDLKAGERVFVKVFLHNDKANKILSTRMEVVTNSFGKREAKKLQLVGVINP